MNKSPEPEFSRIVFLGDSPEEGFALSFEATAAEREALARRFDVLTIERLAAEITLYPKHDGKSWQLDGQGIAEIVQRCVVTLDPIARTNAFTLDRAYEPGAEDNARAESRHQGDEVLTLDQKDAPEPLVGDVIDVGEAIAEEFGLALDPFPRAPGIVFNGYSVGPGDEEERVNPFAALAERRSRGIGEKS